MVLGLTVALGAPCAGGGKFRPAVGCGLEMLLLVCPALVCYRAVAMHAVVAELVDALA